MKFHPSNWQNAVAAQNISVAGYDIALTVVGDTLSLVSFGYAGMMHVTVLAKDTLAILLASSEFADTTDSGNELRYPSYTNDGTYHAMSINNNLTFN